MKEIISVGVGGFGVTVNDTITEGIAKDHGLDQEGRELEGNPYAFFEETRKGQWKSRAMMLDSDSGLVDGI